MTTKRKPGRPRETAEEVEFMLHLRLRRGRDDDLIDFFGSFPRRQRVPALKMALRAGGLTTVTSEDVASEEDLDDALDALLF
jgi:hypothetical protein